MIDEVVLTTHIEGLPLLRRGKVRDIYDAGERRYWEMSEALVGPELVVSP